MSSAPAQKRNALPEEEMKLGTGEEARQKDIREAVAEAKKHRARGGKGMSIEESMDYLRSKVREKFAAK